QRQYPGQTAAILAREANGPDEIFASENLQPCRMVIDQSTGMVDYKCLVTRIGSRIDFNNSTSSTGVLLPWNRDSLICKDIPHQNLLVRLHVHDHLWR